jgi:nitrite reductase/ring-hydroxylating ferredoxin subunit
MQAWVDGEPYAICNVGGELHALDGACPHAGGPLGQGALHGGTLVCPWHAWEYDCITGINDYAPDVKLAKFLVTIEGDDILLDPSVASGS